MLLLLLSPLLFPLFAHAEYLGELSANPFDSASTSNPFEARSLFKSDDINNSYSPYDSPFSNQSATNPFPTETPRLYDQEGHCRGRLTTNPYDTGSVSNLYGRYGILIHQSRSIIRMAPEISIDRTAPPIRMAQAGASKGSSPATEK
jgi:hypothetical protein